MAPTVHQIKNGFVNIYLIIEPQGLTLIDSGTNSGFKAVTRTLANLGRNPSEIKHIVITHSDADHVGSAAALKAATGARLYASQIEADAVARGELSREARGGAFAQFAFGIISRLNPIRPAQIDQIVAEDDELPILGGLRIVSTPGHTPGHISLYAPEHRVLFAGDSLNAFGGKLSFSDGPVTWNYEIGTHSVDKQAQLGAQTVFCGHGLAVHNPVFPVHSVVGSR